MGELSLYLRSQCRLHCQVVADHGNGRRSTFNGLINHLCHVEFVERKEANIRK
jgi:hypothetical protein